ncbi:MULTISPECIES: DUF4276 family protein [Emticicia]|uniref:DUF4276 family protein n=1 Tax=Emticicia TaxID=312278 RepID=UPI00209F70A8|nr:MULTISPECIES: DUF4276 family protein [Emticicia]UTA67077.1 DUF4276 family protein [Emticicia sp. 21SJ11W-3]
MVKLGIICEGESETIIFNSDIFKNWLSSFNIELASVQETGSINQFFDGRFESHRALMLKKGVDFIVALIDLDKEPCLVQHKNKVNAKETDIVAVAVKEFESWYLADSDALSKVLNIEICITHPENIQEPFKEMVSINKGTALGKSKPLLARKMLRANFSIENAANHPNCPSAKYFINKLQSLSRTHS